MRSRRSWRLVAVSGLALSIAAIAVALVLLNGSSRRAGAFVVEPGLDFSIGVGDQCDSSGTPTATCVFPVNSTFTMKFKLNSPGPNLSTTGWEGYDMLLVVHGLTAIEASLTQQGPDVWPACAFPASDFSGPPKIAAACAIGVGADQEREYTGVLLHLDFQCGSTDSIGALTLTPQSETGGDTSLVSSFEAYEEAAPESLTIICGNPPTPTPTVTVTPGGPTDTPAPTPTETPVPTDTPTPAETSTPTITPTPTPRPNHLLRGDVNGDLTVDAIDALLVLQFDAGLIVDVPIPEAADMNDDDLVNATDALYILWVDAGMLTML